ncbi:hypothetical protein JCM19368_27550 [Halomonas shantousis]
MLVAVVGALEVDGVMVELVFRHHIGAQIQLTGHEKVQIQLMRGCLSEHSRYLDIEIILPLDGNHAADGLP